MLHGCRRPHGLKYARWSQFATCYIYFHVWFLFHRKQTKHYFKNAVSVFHHKAFKQKTRRQECELFQHKGWWVLDERLTLSSWLWWLQAVYLCGITLCIPCSWVVTRDKLKSQINGNTIETLPGITITLPLTFYVSLPYHTKESRQYLHFCDCGHGSSKQAERVHVRKYSRG